MSSSGRPFALTDWPAGALKHLAGLTELPARAFFAGPGLRQLASGRAPAALEILTDAGPEAVLSRFPNAIALGGRRIGLPGAVPDVDVLCMLPGHSIEAALHARDLSVNAMAVDPLAKEWIDPYGGRDDLAQQRLRATGTSLRSPLSALRACALVASEGFELDATLLVAMREVAPQLDAVPRARVRSVLEELILADGVGPGLEMLRRSGLEARLAPGVTDGAARQVALLPPDLALRLTAWLRGARGIRILRRLRQAHPVVERVEALLHHHPIEQWATSVASRRKLARRPADFIDQLVLLRRSELVAQGGNRGIQQQLDDLADSIAKLRRAEHQSLARTPLALDGRAVMEHLGIGPGRSVGRALSHLQSIVEAEPA